MGRFRHMIRSGQFVRTIPAPTQGTARDQPVVPVGDDKAKQLNDAKAEIQRLADLVASRNTANEELVAANASLTAAVKRLQAENKKLAAMVQKAKAPAKTPAAEAVAMKEEPEKAAPKKRTTTRRRTKK